MSDIETRDPAVAPGEQARPAGTAPEAAARHCPRCGAGLRPDQDWCLSCGAAVTTEIRRPRGWRLPLALVATVAVLALAAVVVAFIGVADDRETVAQATPTPSPAGSPAPTAVPTPSPGAAVTPSPTPDAGATPSVPGFEDDGTAGGTDDSLDDGTGTTDDGTGLDDGTGTTDDGTGLDDGTGTTGDGTGTTGDGTYESWPAGEAAWTVILYSGLTRDAAEDRADEIEVGGTSVGILESDDFSTLNGGYWVVYSGQYDTRRAAQSSADTLGATADDAYARYVDPR